MTQRQHSETSGNSSAQRLQPVVLLSPMFHDVTTEELSEKPLACLLKHTD